MRNSKRFFEVLICAFFFIPSGNAAQIYQITDLWQGEASARDINDLKQIVGSRGPDARWGLGQTIAVMWDNGKLVDLHAELKLQGRGVSIADRINNQGLVRGQSDNCGVCPGLHDVRNELWFNGNLVTDSTDLSESGLMVYNSLSRPQPPTPEQAFLMENGHSQPLGTLPGKISAAASDVNIHGQVVGISGGLPFIWENGKMIALSLLPGATGGTASGINDSGVIFGKNGRDAVLWDNLELYDLSDEFLNIFDINNRGQVIGGGHGGELLFWDQVTKKTVDIMTLIDPADPFSKNIVGPFLFSRGAINNHGQIVATFEVLLDNGNKEFRALLLTPVSQASVLVGDKDNFVFGDSNDIPPRSACAEKILADISADEGQDLGVDLDVGGNDRPVGLTHYLALPDDAKVTSAKVTFKIRGNNNLVRNDGVYFDCLANPWDENTEVIALKDLLGREPKNNETHTLTINLAKTPVLLGPLSTYPVSTPRYRNLLPLVKSGEVNLVYADDFTVDYSELDVTYVLPSAPSGDLTGDNIVDRDDLDIIVAALNTDATEPDDPRDIDGDHRITILDARKLVVLCWKNGRPRCTVNGQLN